MRDHIKQIVHGVAEILETPSPVVELGSLQVEGQVGYADLRPFFPGSTYVGCDCRQGPGVDLVGNPEHAFPLKSESVGTVVSCDAFEHIFDVFQTMREIVRVMKPNGLCLVISVMYWPIHGYPHDYWRFTPECFRRLLGAFETNVVVGLGDERFPHTVIGIAAKGPALSPEVSQRVERAILKVPAHDGSAWKSPRERALEAELQRRTRTAPTPRSLQAGFRWTWGRGGR